MVNLGAGAGAGATAGASPIVEHSTTTVTTTMTLSQREMRALASSDAHAAVVDIALQALTRLGNSQQVRDLWDDVGVGMRFVGALRAAAASASLTSTTPVERSAYAYASTSTSASLTPFPADCLPDIVDAFAAGDNDAATFQVITDILDAGPPGHCHSRLLVAAAKWVAKAKAIAAKVDDSEVRGFTDAHVAAQAQRASLLERLIAEAPAPPPAAADDRQAVSIDAQNCQAVSIDARRVSIELANAVVAVHSPSAWAPLPPSTLFAASARAHETLDLSYKLRIDRNALPPALVGRFEAMRARGLIVPSETLLRAAAAAMGLDEAALSGESKTSAAAEAALWAAGRSIHDGVDAFGSALSALAALASSPPTDAASSSSSSPSAPLLPEDARAYEVLIEAGLTLADGVASSLGPGGAGAGAPLSALEATLLKGSGRVALLAGFVGHASALSAREGAASVNVCVCAPRRALQGLLTPLLRRSMQDADQASRVLALQLFTMASDLMTSFGGEASPWTRQDLEMFYTAAAAVVISAAPSTAAGSGFNSHADVSTSRARSEAAGGGVRQAAAAATARVVLDLLDSRRLEALTVSPNALWSLVGTLAHCDGQSWALTRVLSAISVPHADSSRPHLTASVIAVSDELAAAAALAAARLRFIDAAHNAWHDLAAFSAIVTDFLWHAAESLEAIAVGPRPGLPGIPWTQLLLVRSSGYPDADILAALPLPTPSLLADGSVLRALPHPATIPQHPLSNTAASVSAFGDALVTVAGGGALLLPPEVVAAALSRAGRGDATTILTLAREFMRLGAWFSPSAVRDLARASLRNPALLPPLLLHLQAQAIALLGAAPDARPMMLRLARSLPVTGSGVDANTLAVLVQAATAGGLLTVALRLLETAPAGWKLPPPAAERLIALALEGGETAVVAQLKRSYLVSSLSSRTYFFSAHTRDDAESERESIAGEPFAVGSLTPPTTTSASGAHSELR